MKKNSPNIVLFGLFPVVLTVLLIAAANLFFEGIYSNLPLQIILYVCSLVGLILFYKLAKSHLWALPVGFTLTSAAFFINDAILGGDMFQFLGAVLYSLIYSLPFFVLSTIISVVLLLKKRKSA